MSRFDLFSSLPKELRLKIWRTTLQDQGRLVTVAPNEELLACRSGVPVISAINRESREEFHRLYVRLPGDSVAQYSTQTDAVAEDQVYFNPRVDTLILGTVTETGFGSYLSGGIESLLLVARCPLGSLIGVPDLPQSVVENVRKVRLHDLNPSRRLEVDLSHRNLKWGPEQHGPIPLPRLRLPNLDVITIVTLCATLWVDNFRCYGHGRYFRYVVPSNQVYYSTKEMPPEEYFGGLRPASKIPDTCLEFKPEQRRAIRIEILRSGDLGWVTKDWNRISGPDDSDHATWLMLVEYLTIRLGNQHT